MVFKKKAVVQKTWKYKGCFQDSWNRLVPYYLGYALRVEDCKNLAIGRNLDTFAIQAGECYGGNKPPYDRLGAASNCPGFFKN